MRRRSTLQEVDGGLGGEPQRKQRHRVLQGRNGAGALTRPYADKEKYVVFSLSMFSARIR